LQGELKATENILKSCLNGQADMNDKTLTYGMVFNNLELNLFYKIEGGQGAI
jgi:hypothetical protein